MTHRPVGAGSSFAFSAGTATTSSAFTVQSDTLRVIAVTNPAFIAVGSTPSATSADYYVPVNTSTTIALTKASNRVVGVTTGTTTIVTVPEGTQVPFGVGDYVTLTASGQSYYNFTHQRVISVDTSSGVDGYFQTRMTVDYNSSGIITAFAPAYANVATSNKVSAYGVGAGTLYYQQVQITNQA
jgi:hypothetical protein